MKSTKCNKPHECNKAHECQDICHEIKDLNYDDKRKSQNQRMTEQNRHGHNINELQEASRRFIKTRVIKMTQW